MSSILDTFQVNLTDANCHILVREFDTEAQICFCFSIVHIHVVENFDFGIKQMFKGKNFLKWTIPAPFWLNFGIAKHQKQFYNTEV